MADWSRPNLDSLEIDVLDEIKARDNSLALMFYQEVDTNKPVNAIQYRWDQGVFKRWDGSSWVNTLISIQGGGTGASTALQARENLGTHNASNLTTGTINRDRLPNASTSAKGASRLNDSTSSTSTTQAATANAVRKAKSEAVPSSVIVRWYGGAIPSGYALCDGTNGTPDLSASSQVDGVEVPYIMKL